MKNKKIYGYALLAEETAELLEDKISSFIDDNDVKWILYGHPFYANNLYHQAMVATEVYEE